MLVNADFAKRVIVHAQAMDWTPSPVGGVERKMLDRIGDEVARATSLVRFAAGSAFTRHTHGGGEEFLVLEGVFQDETGDFPAGFYVRNPPGSSHAPASASGCVLFVKLHQFDPADRVNVRVDTRNQPGMPSSENAGVRRLPLFHDAHEDVRIEEWSAGARARFDVPGGYEALVLAGDLLETGDRLTQGSWIRIPAGSSVDATAGERGAKLWVKSGHLQHVVGEAFRGGEA